MGTNLLYEAAIMVGTSSTKVSDYFRGSSPSASDMDFQIVSKATQVIPSVFSEFDVHGSFNDAIASPSQSLAITHNAYAWTTDGNRKYIIVDYSIKNNGNSTLNNLYAGIAADWDIDANTASDNKANYDATKKLGYVYSTASGGKYAGIKALNNTAPTVCYHIDNITGGGGGIDVVDTTVVGNKRFSTSKKYTSLSTNRYLAGVSGTVTTGSDIIEVVSSGPFTINSGDSIKVAFALIAGDDLTDISKSADSADVHYNPSIPTSIANISKTEITASVFPNPTNSDLNFMINSPKTGDVEIVLLNTLGQTVKQINPTNLTIGANQIHTDISQLPAGTYLYQITTPDKILKGKILITK
jgi:serine protease